MKIKSKRIVVILLLAIILSQSITTNSYAIAPKIKAQAGIVIDQKTGDVLYSKDPDSLMVPASMTKIMTAYIIFEEIELGNITKDTLVKVSPNTARLSRNNNYPMAVPLEANASYTVDKFLELIMIPSASASCIAMAEYISGSEQAFVKRMNDTAKKMGLNANFKNSHGAKPHYITARSMAKLIKNFIDKYPDILNYTSLKSITFRGRTYSNTNKLLSSYSYKGANGFKTGTIPEAGFCLASTAERDGNLLIGVIMKSTNNHNRHNDSKLILDYGFSELANRKNIAKNLVLEFTDLPNEIRLNSDYNIKVLPKNISGKVSGDIIWKVNDEIVSQENIVIENNKPIILNYFTDDRFLDDININVIFKTNDMEKTQSTTLAISSKYRAQYRDINNNWAEDKITQLLNKKIVYGYNPEYYGVNMPVTRDLFITTLGRMVENLELEEFTDENVNFKDVNSDNKNSKYINWAVKNNIIESEEYFYPNNEITREEVAKILANLLEKYSNIELGKYTNELADSKNINPLALDSVLKILNTKIMNLNNKSNFQGEKVVQRAEMSSMIFDCYDILNSK